MEWKPIETAPKDGTDVLLFANDSIAIAAWQTDWPNRGEWATGYSCADYGDYYVKNPTHWMSLPEPPAA